MFIPPKTGPKTRNLIMREKFDVERYKDVLFKIKTVK